MTGPPPRFVVGEAQLCTGVYTAHWEFSRFAAGQPRRMRRGMRAVNCLLVAAPGVAETPMEVLGIQLPPAEEWRRNPGLRFYATMKVTPLERGHFGHRGAMRWRLRVDQWLEVHSRDAHN